MIIIPLCACFLSKSNHNNSNKSLWKNASFRLASKTTVNCLIVLLLKKALNLPPNQRCPLGNEDHCSYLNRRLWFSRRAWVQGTNHRSKQISWSKNCRIRKPSLRRIILYQVLLLLLVSLQINAISLCNSLHSSFQVISRVANRLKYLKSIIPWICMFSAKQAQFLSTNQRKLPQYHPGFTINKMKLKISSEVAAVVPVKQLVLALRDFLYPITLHPLSSIWTIAVRVTTVIIFVVYQLNR